MNQEMYEGSDTEAPRITENLDGMKEEIVKEIMESTKVLGIKIDKTQENDTIVERLNELLKEKEK